MNFLLYRITKAYELMPPLVMHPRRMRALFNGATPGRLVSLDVPWIKKMGIESVLDIGANTGQFAATIHYVLPKAQIYSFEPLLECFESLMSRMSPVSGFHGYNVALGDQDSEIEFQRNEFSQSSSVLPHTSLQQEAFAWAAASQPVKVQMSTLDSIMRDIPLRERLLVKIDVEGFEDRVLRGGEATIRKASVVITETSFEQLHEGQPSFEDVQRLMSGYGFRYAGNLDQLLNPIDGKVLQADAIFLRRDA